MQIKAGKENSMEDRYLFRAKRTDNEEWIEGLPSYDINGNLTEFEVYRGFANCEIADVDSETVCQWTGLTDKNNRKIFEGDICKIHSGPIDEEDGCFSVEWDEGDARFALYSVGLTVDFGNYHGHECEVIGNIFDNPDLLPEEDT